MDINWRLTCAIFLRINIHGLFYLSFAILFLYIKNFYFWTISQLHLFTCINTFELCNFLLILSKCSFKRIVLPPCLNNINCTTSHWNTVNNCVWFFFLFSHQFWVLHQMFDGFPSLRKKLNGITSRSDISCAYFKKRQSNSILLFLFSGMGNLIYYPSSLHFFNFNSLQVFPV